MPAAEYARYCLYLVARYGAQHVVYLVGADGNGLEPQVEAGGREVHQWDCYQQPTGIHYRPHSTAEAQQDEPWLDFQWCQTGHEGEHVPERAALLWSRSPTKAAANGEPTYENGRRTGKASGWWQGHEAWASSAAPGACGSGRCDRTSPARNRTSSPLAAAGARRWTSRDLVTWAWLPASSTACRPRGLTVPGELHILYLEGRRRLRVTEAAVLPRFYAMIDPRTGNVHGQRECEPRQGGRRSFIETPDGPCVVVFTRRPLAWRELG